MLRSRVLVHVLGAQAEQTLAPVRGERGGWCLPGRQGVVADLIAHGRPGPDDPGRQQPDRRCADEVGHEGVERPVVEVAGRRDLHHPARVEDGHPVAERERLGLVMGDVEGGHAGGADDFAQVLTHADPLGGIEVRQRLVEQERVGRTDERAADADPRLLAVRERCRFARQQARES